MNGLPVACFHDNSHTPPDALWFRSNQPRHTSAVSAGSKTRPSFGCCPTVALKPSFIDPVRDLPSG